MRRAVLITILCLIAISQIACARRTARVLRIPSTPHASASAPPSRGDQSVREMREAIQSLKNQSGSDSTRLPGTAAPTTGALPPSGVTADPKSTGTAGVLSVESRYPASPDGGAWRPNPRGRLLNRAGDAARRMGGETWAGLIAICAIAGALVLVLARRRARAST